MSTSSTPTDAKCAMPTAKLALADLCPFAMLPSVVVNRLELIGAQNGRRRGSWQVGAASQPVLDTETESLAAIVCSLGQRLVALLAGPRDEHTTEVSVFLLKSEPVRGESCFLLFPFARVR